MMVLLISRFFNNFFFSKLGSFFLLNLFVVVISVQFGETKQRETDRIKLERRLLTRNHSTCASFSSESSNSCWKETLKYVVSRLEKTVVKLGGIFFVNTKSSRPTNCCRCSRVSTFRQEVKSFIETKLFENTIFAAIFINSIFMGIEHHEQVNSKFYKSSEFKLISFNLL